MKFTFLLTLAVLLLLVIARAASPSAIPDDSRDLAQKAADAFKADHFDEAAVLYQQIIHTHPDSLYAWSNLGVVRFQQGNYGEARKALEQALTLNPKDAFCLSNLGIVYYNLKSYDKAISSLEAAIAVNPDDAMTHYFLGQAYDQVGRHADAEREQKKARELQAKRPPLENSVLQPKVLT